MMANPIPQLPPMLPMPPVAQRARRARAIDAFEAEARAQRQAVGAFHNDHPRGRAGGALLRDTRLVRDARTGRLTSADSVNRAFRRLAADKAALQARYEPTNPVMWNHARTRMMANTEANRREVAEEARQARAPDIDAQRRHGINAAQDRRELVRAEQRYMEGYRREMGELNGPHEDDDEDEDWPATLEIYRARLAAAWGPTWGTGPGFRLGTRATMFHCKVLTCIKKCNMLGNDAIGDVPGRHERINPRVLREYGPGEAPYLRAPRGAGGEFYHFRDPYLFNGEGALTRVLLDNDECVDARTRRAVVDAPGHHASRPLGDLYFRSEHLIKSTSVNLEIPTAFLQEHLAWGTSACPIGPFLPAQGRWAFMQDSRLPVEPWRLMDMLREMCAISLEEYTERFDEAHLAAHPERFDGNEDVAARHDEYNYRRFERMYPDLARIRSGASFVLLIERTSAIDGGEAVAVDPAEAPLGEGIAPRLISSVYMKIVSDPSATSLEKWIQPPTPTLMEAREGLPCCVMEDFLSTWKGPIEEALAVADAKQRIRLPDALPSLTVAGLQAYFGLQPDEYRVTVPAYSRLLKAFGLGADFYEVTGKRTATVFARTHKLVPKRAVYIVKNDHLYRLTEKQEGLFKAETLSTAMVPSARFPLSKDKAIRVFLETADDLMTWDRSEYKKGTRFDVRLNEPLDRLLYICREKWSVDPEIAMSSFGAVITSLSLRVDGHMLRIRMPVSPGTDQIMVPQTVPSEDYIDRFEERTGALLDAIVKPSLLSHYSPEVVEWMKADNRAALIGRIHWDDEDDGPTTEVDICRAYPTVLRRLKKIPVLIASDVPEVYDGHAIEPYTVYEVRRTCDLRELPSVGHRVMLNNAYNRIAGLDLKHHWDRLAPYIEVLSFVRPYLLAENEAPAFIDALFRDDLLSGEHKKLGGVVDIGKLGRKQNKAHLTKLFDSESEAAHYKSAHHGKMTLYPYKFTDDPEDPTNSRMKAWHVWESEVASTRLTEGFLAHFFVLSGSRADLADSCFMLEEEGHTIVELHTDAAYIRGSFTSEPLDKTNPDNLGKRSWTPKPLSKNILTWSYGSLPWGGPPEPMPLTDVTMADEWSCHEVTDLVRKSDALVLGVCAGSGKTTLCSSVIGNLNGTRDALWVVPNNIRKRKLLSEGLCVDTYASLVGMRCDDDGADLASFEGVYLYGGKGGRPLSDFKFLVCDEVYSIDADTRDMLTRLIGRIRGWETPLRILATGDTTQLLVEPDLNPHVDVKRVLSRWGRGLFPTAILLKEPKRFPLAKDKEIVLGLHDALAKDRGAVLGQFKTIRVEDVPTDAKCITYLQSTRSRLNSYMHFKEHTVPLEVGTQLIYRERSRKQGKNKLFVGFSYTVTAVSADGFSIVEDGEPEVTFDLRRPAMSWFTYHYARTCHSSQGSTFEGMVVIADTRCKRVDDAWLYVALTRARKLRRDVRILEGLIPAAVDLARIEAMVAGNLRADADAGRVVAAPSEPVTVDWVLERDAVQGGKCALCGLGYELPKVGCERTTGTASVDRTNSDLGHSIGNCKLTCRGCNFAKRNRLV